MIMEKVNLRGLATRFPREIPLLIQFNFNPASHLHISRRDELFPEIPAAVWRVQRVLPRISTLLLQKIGLSNAPCFEIPNPYWPLVLLPPDRLARVATHVGALAVGIRVRSSLSRDHVLAWKSKLGEEAYRFALNSASLVQVGKLPLAELASDSPTEIGYRLILASLGDAPESMFKRAYLKIPTGLNAAEVEASKITRLLNNVLGIVEAEWYSSFAAIRR